MNCVIDLGNTTAKAAIYNKTALTSHEQGLADDALVAYATQPAVTHIGICAVGRNPAGIIAQLGNRVLVSTLTTQTPIPITMNYATPQTLGTDRLAAVMGAYYRLPGTDCLVIDAGTCITYEFLDRHGAYHGGAIAPGMGMRFRAMHTFTNGLPLIEFGNNLQQPKLTGGTTAEAMMSGVIHGMVAEIDGIINQYLERVPQLKVILCGGDAQFFETRIKAPIFAVPELVLEGLNRVLLYNDNQI